MKSSIGSFQNEVDFSEYKSPRSIASFESLSSSRPNNMQGRGGTIAINTDTEKKEEMEGDANMNNYLGALNNLNEEVKSDNP